MKKNIHHGEHRGHGENRCPSFFAFFAFAVKFFLSFYMPSPCA
jgi:hypothetical protein